MPGLTSTLFDRLDAAFKLRRDEGRALAIASYMCDQFPFAVKWLHGQGRA